MTKTIRDRTPKHQHPKHKLCVHCANVTMHDLQCQITDQSCIVVTCEQYKGLDTYSLPTGPILRQDAPNTDEHERIRNQP